MGMKKRRGLRRYYRKLRQLNEFASAVSWLEDIHDPDSWFYYAHIHFDWSGYGDTRWKERAEHLDVMFRHYDMFAGECRQVDRAYQVYAVVHEFDSGSDALYVHTPNPYGDNYPMRWNYTETCTFKTKNLIEYLGKLKAQGYSVLYAPAGSRYSDCIVFQESLGDNKQLQEENI